MTLATPTMLQLRAAFTVAATWLFGAPARPIGRLVAWRLVWGAMGDLLCAKRAERRLLGPARAKAAAARYRAQRGGRR